MNNRRFLWAGVAFTMASATVAGVWADSYSAAIERWRAAREVALRADDGWLTVVGLFWLRPGLNRVGTDPSNDIVLPDGSAPARLGVFEFSDGRTVFQAEPGTRVTSADAIIERLEMPYGANPTQVAINDLTMFVIRRGERYGIRLRDRNSKAREMFAGLRYFPIDPAYRVTAAFVAYPEPKKLPIPNVLGDTPEMMSPGYVEFSLDGQALRLEPVYEGDSPRELFFIFGDQTNGTETYPAGRFLYTDLPLNGKVELDFNKAQNPPCAFTAFATCPLPPKQNRLPIRVRAGEMDYGHHGS